MRRLLATAILTVAAVMSASQAARATDSAVVSLSDCARGGGTTTVPPGAQITIQLPGNATTGYTWAATVGDPSVLNEAGPAAFSLSSDALGAGGTYTFRYRAAASGQTDLTLVYKRSWEAGTPPLRTYRITVVVR